MTFFFTLAKSSVTVGSQRILKRVGHWDFRFCGFGYLLDRFFGFGVHCGLRIFRLFSNWFSVFMKNTSVFTVLESDMVSGFSYFVLFGFRFLFDL